ncbi:coiled-coil domain-containing protein 138 isoform X2 [Parambassis ranga]|uniref:Coiled-coil domain-containing protein 138 isoform X2 n=1 Tax=Parambassis ranga TaxID=210632 RepID=A0A6P7HEH9_9TELE|nr:coiled-coil domain-containing protein 138 isoform X2 [Parambassis ranga]
MNTQFKDRGVNDTVERLKQEYLERRRKVSATEDVPSADSVKAVQRLNLSQSSKQSTKELMSLGRFARERRPHGSNEDLNADSTAAPLQDSQVLFTETDVTLPSCLDGSPDTCSFVLGKVYREMMSICEELKAERQSQQQWQEELYERERRIKQQEKTFGRPAELEEMVHARVLAVEEKHQQELSQLQDLLQEKNKENKRLKSSFVTMKELNNNMKKQLNEISEQNKQLECRSKRVQARLENLQRKCEHSIASRGCHNVGVKSTECIKPSVKERTAASGRNSRKGGLSPTLLKLLALLMDWVLSGQTFSSFHGNEEEVIDQCLPPEVLPLLADQLHHTPSSEPKLLLNLLRLIYLALRQLDNSTQHVVLSATLRRIGEEVSKPSAQSTMLSEDPELPKSCTETAGSFRSWPLYRSPCPHTRVLSILIILCTVTQVDVLAQTLRSLRTEMMCEVSRGLYIHYGGVHVLLECLRSGRAGLHTPIDILMQLTELSRYLNGFLEACSCEEFFRAASQLLTNPRLELPSLEKFCVLLQKLSSIRTNRHLFELSSLHVQIKELHQKTSPSHTFLCLNLRSILHNLR